MAKILIVDDRESNRHLLVMLLGYGGHVLMEAADGEQALGIARSERPDLVISDIVMPAMDGYEFVRQLRAIPELADTRVIFYTATFREVEARKLARSCGVQHVMIKPSEPDVILRTVEEALGGTSTTAPATPAATAEQFRHEHLALLTNKLAQKVNELESANGQLQQALDQLKAAQQCLVQQERLHALGQMAGGIAHDFNNALAPILGFSELLLRHPDKTRDPATLKSYLEMINTSAKDAAHVVRGLREFYRRREKGEVFLPLDLNRLVGQVVELTQPRWKQQAQSQSIDIEMRTELDRIPAVYGNESELREVLINLVFNAVDALPGGGQVYLRTKAEANQVLLEVSDTGAGMPEEVRQHCFEPFYTTKGERGTGLGLAMVYGIIQRHEGTIDIQSQVGKGTTFVIHLPVKTWQQFDATRTDAGSELKPCRVLVVDDEPMILDFMSNYLTGDGHTVECAASGAEALDKFANHEFDLVITDCAMPGMGGEKLALLLKQRKPRIPVIMLTGFGVEIQATGQRPDGVDCLLSKPITISDMRQAMQEAMASS